MQLVKLTRVGLQSNMTCILVRGCEDRNTQGECNVVIKADTGVTQVQAKELQRMPANHRKETRKDFPGPSEHLDFALLASTIMKQYISIVSSHPVCGAVLW